MPDPARLFADHLHLAGACAARFVRGKARWIRSRVDDVRTAALWGLWCAARSFRVRRRVPFPAWARKVIRCRLVDWLRAEARHQRALSLDAPLWGDQEGDGRPVFGRDLIAARQEQEAPAHCTRLATLALAALPARDRRIARLYFESGLVLTQVARRLGMCQAAAYRRMDALLERCRETLEASGELPANLRGRRREGRIHAGRKS